MSAGGHCCCWCCRCLQARSLGQDEELLVEPEDLSPEDLVAFERALAAGQLGHLVEVWQPWWLSSEARELSLNSQGQRMVEVQEQGGPGPREDTAPPQQLPAANAEPLVPVASLTKSAPSPLLRWQLLQLLYGYCWVMRRYNGEPGLPDVVTEAAHLLLAVCPPLAVAGPQRPAGGQPRPQEEPGSQQQGQGPVVPQSPGQALLECISAACVPPAGDATSRYVKVFASVGLHGLYRCSVHQKTWFAFF
jgi:hypothetical protein